jgi:DNA-binding NarL/FixJ family response regulator
MVGAIAVPNLRILLAEDHQMVREGLKALVNSQPDMTVVGEAGDGQAAIQQARELDPDVIVMDVSMPRMSGLEATAKIKDALPDAKVLALTRHTDTGFLRQLFKAGAAGYVLKQSASSELIRAIRAVAAGDNYLDPSITGKVVNSYVAKQASHLEPGEDLTPREEEVLKMIAWGNSNKDIASNLGISVKTVEAHKANLMKKLSFRSRIDIVRFAVVRGWLQET